MIASFVLLHALSGLFNQDYSMKNNEIKAGFTFFFYFIFFCHTQHPEVEPISTFWLPQATSHSGCRSHLPVIWHHVSQRTKRPNMTQWVLLCKSSETPTTAQPLHNPVMFRHSAGFSGNVAFRKMIAHNQAEGWTRFQFLHTILC